MQQRKGLLLELQFSTAGGGSQERSLMSKASISAGRSVPSSLRPLSVASLPPMMSTLSR